MYKLTPNNDQNNTPNSSNPSNNPPQTKKYPIELFEWEKLTEKVVGRGRNARKDILGEGRINRQRYTLEIPIDKKIRLSDVKEYIKEESINKYTPICKCFLKIYKDVFDIPKNINQEYEDDVFLGKTVFDENNTIFIGIPK